MASEHKQGSVSHSSITPVHFRFKGCWVVFCYFYLNFKIFCKANSGDPDQMPHSAASDLILHCMPVSNKKDKRLIWVKI